MKYAILFWMMAFACLIACTDDEDPVLQVSVPEESIRFVPVEGGAVMYYSLPSPTDIYTVWARYTNAQGEEMALQATAYLDSLNLMGFNEARQNVPVEITFTDRNNVASEPLYRTFSTLDSSPYAFLDSVEVSCGWNGIFINYKFSKEAAGLMNVFYIGTNAYTKQADTLYVDNLQLEKGEKQVFFPINFEYDENTVVLRTEDYQGYNARTKCWSGLRAYASEQLPASEFELLDPEEMSMENEQKAYGLKYLTDGDVKGENRLLYKGDSKYYTYMTKAEGVGSYLIVDMKEPRVPASVRLYGMFDLSSAGLYFNDEFHLNYADRLPCKVTLYGSNDQKSWERLAQFSQKSDGSQGCWGTPWMGPVKTKEEMDQLDPNYCEVICPLGNTEYRYLKVQYDELFNMNPMFANDKQYVSFHELEVYVKKD